MTPREVASHFGRSTGTPSHHVRAAGSALRRFGSVLWPSARMMAGPALAGAPVCKAASVTQLSHRCDTGSLMTRFQSVIRNKIREERTLAHATSQASTPVSQGGRPEGEPVKTISTKEAFEAYEAVRHRLPTVAASGARHRRAETLADIADGFDVFLLDAFGVLNIGETAIPGTRERIDDLRAAGKRVLVVSNAAGFPHAALTEKYTRLGFDFAPEDVITSRVALLDGLKGREDLHWGLMATRSTGLQDFEDLTLSYLEEDPDTYDRVDGFLLVGSMSWTEPRQALLEAALERRPRPVLVGNPDIVAPRETSFSIEPGHFAHRLADRTGIVPEFYGKPFPGIFELAFKRLGDVDRSRVLMVGDSLHTDILGARNVGIASALIAQYGFFAGHDAEEAVRAAGIVPDFIVERP